GFRRGKSTVDCLSFVVHDLARCIDKHKKVVGVFFDVKKAFDKCVHTVLLRKLSVEFNVPHYLLIWLRSYLTGRMYRVSANGTFSNRKSVVSGVPQGSVLGPVLFLCYVNCFRDIQFSNLCKIAMFADDIFLYKPVPNQSDIVEFQSDLKLLLDAVNDQYLLFAPPKCKCIVFSYSPRPVDFPPLYLGTDALERVNEWRYLGVILDSKLNFIPQTRATVVKGKRAIGALCRKFRNYAPNHVLLKVYLTCIVPAFLYGVEVWYPSTKYCRMDLERVHRMMARLLTNDFVSHYEYLLDVLKWNPIWKRVLVFQMRLFYKLVHSSSFVTLLPPQTNRRSMRVNNSRTVNLTSLKAATCNLFFYRAVKIWNTFPEHVVAFSLKSFIEYLKTAEFITLLRDNNILPVVSIR
ncbi:MAG: hypothetical protein GY820_18430, partial [Gammaproteobacteria bacterium]|nr:hypothetical protein [Gammaproteobacteria bacterium]